MRRPARRSTQADYASRVARAMAHVAADLDAPLDLARVAEVAAFSPCHFHRIFRLLAGETLAEHVARARLSRAARDLIEGRLPLARIARRAGYAGIPAFARAFRAAHGIPPAAYRARGGIGRTLPVHPTHDPEERDPMYAVRTETYPALRLAAIGHRGRYDEIGPVFDALQAWAAGAGLVGPGTRFFGRYFDDPKSVPAAALRSEACLTLPPGTVLPECAPAHLVEVPGFSAAVLRFKGPYAEFEAPYDWFYGTWLPGSGREPADIPCMEEYLNDPRALPPSEWLTDIILPLKAAAPVPA